MFAARSARPETTHCLDDWNLMNDTDRLKLRIAELQLEHRGLDQLIQSLSVIHEVDELALRRMKKRKLQLKDMIVRLQMQLVPDVPA